jgi:hypothetical protein
MFGETKGTVCITLRLEGLCVLMAASLMYSKLQLSWSHFALFFLVPDISFVGYLFGAKVGAVTYNAAHSYIGAILCLTAGLFFSASLFISIGLIWCAHIGFDRALGYGLKYSRGFGYTHLGLIGKWAKTPLKEDS